MRRFENKVSSFVLEAKVSIQLTFHAPCGRALFQHRYFEAEVGVRIRELIASLALLMRTSSRSQADKAHEPTSIIRVIPGEGCLRTIVNRCPIAFTGPYVDDKFLYDLRSGSSSSQLIAYLYPVTAQSLVATQFEPCSESPCSFPWLPGLRGICPSV